VVFAYGLIKVNEEGVGGRGWLVKRRLMLCLVWEVKESERKKKSKKVKDFSSCLVI